MADEARDDPDATPDQVERARKLLQDAIARSRPESGPAMPLPPAPATHRPQVPGMKAAG